MNINPRHCSFSIVLQQPRRRENAKLCVKHNGPRLIAVMCNMSNIQLRIISHHRSNTHEYSFMHWSQATSIWIQHVIFMILTGQASICILKVLTHNNQMILRSEFVNLNTKTRWVWEVNLKTSTHRFLQVNLTHQCVIWSDICPLRAIWLCRSLDRKPFMVWAHVNVTRGRPVSVVSGCWAEILEIRRVPLRGRSASCRNWRTSSSLSRSISENVSIQKEQRNRLYNWHVNMNISLTWLVDTKN